MLTSWQAGLSSTVPTRQDANPGIAQKASALGCKSLVSVGNVYMNDQVTN